MKFSKFLVPLAALISHLDSINSVEIQHSFIPQTIEKTLFFFKIRPIGKLYYEDHKEEADGAYGQQMQAIADAFAAIDHMKEEVLKIKGARQCPQCGATVPEDTEFCGKCGAKLNIFED